MIKYKTGGGDIMNDNKSTNIGSEIESLPHDYISDSTKWMIDMLSQYIPINRDRNVFGR